MKRLLSIATVLALFVACGKFDTDDTGNHTTTAGIPEAGTDANGVPEAGAADAYVPPASLNCPDPHFLCEPFDSALDPEQWSPWKGEAPELPATTEPVGSGRVLVSDVKGAPVVLKQGARVIHDLMTEEPIVIELDMKVDPPFVSGKGANNFGVFIFGTDNINVTFYVTDTGLIQFNSSIKDQEGDGYTPHSINEPHLQFGEWAHYVIRASLGATTSLELTRDGVTLAKGSVTTAGQLNEFVALGVARNNNSYDLHAEYDNVVVYPQ